jgi:hypothetical protein
MWFHKTLKQKHYSYNRSIASNGVCTGKNDIVHIKSAKRCKIEWMSKLKLNEWNWMFCGIPWQWPIIRAETYFECEEIHKKIHRQSLRKRVLFCGNLPHERRLSNVRIRDTASSMCRKCFSCWRKAQGWEQRCAPLCLWYVRLTTVVHVGGSHNL